MNIELGQIISQIIAFLLMLAILKRYAWKPLFRFMEERRERIQNEFATIEKKNQEVLSLKETYQGKVDHFQIEIKKLRQEEERKARAHAREIEDEAQKHAREIMHRARKDAAEEVLKAKEDYKKILVDMTIEATEAILQKDLDQEKQHLITQYIEEAHFQ